MIKISIYIGLDGKGSFALKKGCKILGRIQFSLRESELTLMDTLVPVKCYFHLIGFRILGEVVEYARMHELKIVTLSKFAQRQFSSHPVLYADVWEKSFKVNQIVL